MKLLFAMSIPLLFCAAASQAAPLNARPAGYAAGILHLAGSTSSNSSSNTSSNSSSGRSSYVRTHSWSVDSDDGYRRRKDRGVRIERYSSRPYDHRRDFDDDDD